MTPRYPASTALAGRRILLVEDADDIRDLLAFLLRSEGAEVRAARCARDAVESAAAWDFDALVTDIGLPDVSGDHLIREIFGIKTRRPRVIVITGFGEPYVARAREAGADAVFTKPLEWTVLRDELSVGNTALAA